MEIALVTDIHYGIKSDAHQFLDYTEKFFTEVFFPYIDDNNIKVVGILGDIFDRRKYINIYTANRIRSDFLNPLKKREVEVFIIAGNHDVYHKNTNEVNALTELINREYGFNVFLDPAEITIDGTKILLVPWINEENYSNTIDMIGETKAHVCFGHLELAGFEMQRGVMKHDGEDREDFSKFDVVCSGHYHHKSSDGNIHYLGSPVQFTWADYNDTKGFHVFDTETRLLKFIKNPFEIFHKIFYDDKDKTIDEAVNEFDFASYKNTMVKVVVQEKTNPYWFDMFIDNLYANDVVDLQIVEDHHNLDNIEDEKILSETEDTITIFNNYIDSIESDKVNKESLKNVINQLHIEALLLE